MAILTAVSFVVFLVCGMFVAFPNLVVALFNRVSGSGGLESDYERAGFLTIVRRLSVVPMIGALAAAIYCGSVAREDARRRPLLEQQAAEKADKVRRYSSAGVYTQSAIPEKRPRSGARP